MSIFDLLRDKLVADRKTDEAYFAFALQEFQSGKIRPGLMAKAISESHGDQNKANAIYLRLLTEAIKDDTYIEQRSHQKRQESLARAKARIEGINASGNKSVENQGRSFADIWNIIWEFLLTPIIVGVAVYAIFQLLIN